MLGRTCVAAWGSSAGIILTVLCLVDPSTSFAVGPSNACDAITGSGEEILEITVSPTGGSVTVRTARGSCVQKLNDLVNEPLPVPQDPPAAAAQKRPTQPAAAVVPIPLPADAQAGTKRPPPWEVKDCLPLADVWKGGSLRIGQNTYGLSRIYTLDRNADSVVDDVAFVLESRGASNLIIRYQAEPGILSAKMLPELRLDDDSLISRLCFGTLQYELPELPALRPFFVVPDLAAEARAREAGLSKPKKAPAPKTALFTGTQMAIGFAAFAALAAIGGAILFIVSRRRAAEQPGEVDGEEAEV